MKRKDDKGMKKQVKRMVRRHPVAIVAGAALLMAAGWAARETLWDGFCASLVSAVPAAAALLLVFWHIKGEERKKKRTRQRGNARDGAAGKTQTAQEAWGWYDGYARARLVKLAADLKKEGVAMAWIRPDGVCNISTPQGYRRRAVLTGFPAGNAEAVAEWIRSDNIARAKKEGKYLRLSFGSRRAA